MMPTAAVPTQRSRRAAVLRVLTTMPTQPAPATTSPLEVTAARLQPATPRQNPRCQTRSTPRLRSEERRGGEEGRSRWAPGHLKKKKRKRRWNCDWSSDVCSSDLGDGGEVTTGNAKAKSKVSNTVNSTV